MGDIIQRIVVLTAIGAMFYWGGSLSWPWAIVGVLALGVGALLSLTISVGRETVAFLRGP